MRFVKRSNLCVRDFVLTYWECKMGHTDYTLRPKLDCIYRNSRRRCQLLLQSSPLRVDNCSLGEIVIIGGLQIKGVIATGVRRNIIKSQASKTLYCTGHQGDLTNIRNENHNYYRDKARRIPKSFYIIANNMGVWTKKLNSWPKKALLH